LKHREVRASSTTSPHGSCASYNHLAIRQSTFDQTTNIHNMANRQGYDVVVDVDAEVCACRIEARTEQD
jgi:hypothetical protein